MKVHGINKIIEDGIVLGLDQEVHLNVLQNKIEKHLRERDPKEKLLKLMIYEVPNT